MLDVFAGFVHELREAGLPVSLTEDIDAMEALRHLALEDRQGVKHALAATLVKSQAHRKAFDAVFEIYFSPRWAVEGHLDGEGAAPSPLSSEELAVRLEQALAADDGAMLQALVSEAVTRYAGMEAGRPVGARYYLYRTLRHLDLDGMLERLLATSGHEAPEEVSDLHERLMIEDHRLRLERLRSEVDREVRRRLVAERGCQPWAGPWGPPFPRAVDFIPASPAVLPARPRALFLLPGSWPAPLPRRAGPCFLSPGSWQPAWPDSAGTVEGALCTSATPSVIRSPTVASRWSSGSGVPAPPSPRSS